MANTTTRKSKHGRLRHGAEYAVVWALVRGLGLLPRRMARCVAVCLVGVVWRLVPRLQRVGERNLELAYPEMPARERRRVLRGLRRSLGRQMAEFCKMSGYTREQASKFIEYDGLEHYVAARARGKGVLVVTGHLGAWELSSFYHSLMGHPMALVIRRLDNPLVDGLVNRVRCMHGNRVLHKDDFARGLLATMREGGTVGILMDTNMTPPQGVFVPFFGLPACTASGVARVAVKTGAAVLPGCLLWEPEHRKYVLHFGEEIVMQATGDDERDAVENTARCTQALEAIVRRRPEQWLWVHRRWKTRPEGEPALY
jgi:KDO2-lipid IV(A) lauroyltransferase